MINDILKRNNVTVTGNLSSTEILVFAHGFGTDQTAWKDVIPSFSNSYKIVLYDNIGAGKADIHAYNPIKYKNFEGYVDDLISICEFLDLNDAIFVGHSASSMIGMLTTISNPEFFSKLILIGASPRYLNDTNYLGGFTQEYLDKLYAEMSASYYDWVSGFSKLAMANDGRPSLQQAFTESLLSLRPDIALAVVKSIFQSDLRDILDKVDKEVLIMQSNNDIAVPAEVGVYLNAHIKNSKLVTVNAEGHFPHISEPEKIVKGIKEFIATEIQCP